MEDSIETKYNDDMTNIVFSDDDDLDYHDHHQTPSKTYIILKEADIRREIDADVSQLSDVLSISKLEASILLRYYSWSFSKVNDAWFADESRVRKKVGLLPESSDRHRSSDNTCAICFELYSFDSLKSAPCGHQFCVDCWRLYIEGHIDDGAGCLMLRCPQPECRIAVAEDMVDELVIDVDKKNKYHNFLLRSYIEDNKKRKWCPAPNCECAIEFSAGGDDKDFDVSCLCSHSFCWMCIEEPHRPVDCETVSNWKTLNESESENETWKKAYTKNCPKCNRSIEKNEGCMHMTCSSPCRYEFCWLCLNDWKRHNSCNKYNVDKKTEELQQHLVRYQHYYDRWAANHKSWKIAIADLDKVRSDHILKLSIIQGQPETQLSFLTETWKQIVECRRVLKWTYAYGYYLKENEIAKKGFFEYLQGQAEAALERLHHEAETKVAKFLNANEPPDEFSVFRQKLVGLTEVTKTFFENLVSALENGLSDVNSDKQEDGCSSDSNNKRKYNRIKTKRETRLAARPPTNQTGEWTCSFCTYINPSEAVMCETCYRGAWSCPYCSYANSRSATTCEMCDEGGQGI